ncbi:patatin-like phospholipase family protein [Bacillus sp. EB600]|uniref:patatin-like phospholipase family protein n=1 Tax=Bacillus sp. EB600 TaxID=2806345 RepID=UPI00210A6DF9|nr:patatin-like phospholipase family protein [Bacillus sp. EB600]MCQ6281643.1 patatin-like phospholipase family protein [Bacillus sp. EB600]
MEKKKILLALQGGGAYGAFTWGVLDRLLEEENLEVVAVSGTSAGAVNASLLAYGLTIGNRETAREKLGLFWRKISEWGMFSLFQPTWLDKIVSRGNMDFNPFYQSWGTISSFLSPYQLNPFDINPLKNILNETIDFEKIRNNQEIKLFLSATNVRTSQLRVFDTHEVTVDTVLASACVPQIYRAVEINGEHYWDGGYVGNPSLFPLLWEHDCNDLMVVQIEPTNYPKLPTNAHEILDRAYDISFNTSLMREIRVINSLNKLVDHGFDYHGQLEKVNIHFINTVEGLNNLDGSSKLNVSWDFLIYLRDFGRKNADLWIKENYDKIGVKSTFDVEKFFGSDSPEALVKFPGRQKVRPFDCFFC